ncbi:MAG: sulfur carrier protein ThiS [Rhodobacteraceae bacterium]|nr:sulfur carrier protein ThiS [Paracoccaceae bacterium]
MNIQLNGSPLQTGATTLDALLIEAGFEQAVVATAINGDFIPLGQRADYILSDGDRIEVLAPMQGG